MTNFGRFKAGTLSGGMKQKLGLTCALVHTPKVLLLDEPTTGVDPVSRRDFWRILYGLREEGVTIVIATAYLDEAERCNRLTLLYAGHALYCDTPAALKAHMPGALIAHFLERRPRGACRDRRRPGREAMHCSSATASMRWPTTRPSEFPSSATSSPAPAFPSPISRVGTPSIEDVFVALTETGDRRMIGLANPRGAGNLDRVIAEGLVKRFGDFVAVDT